MTGRKLQGGSETDFRPADPRTEAATRLREAVASAGGPARAARETGIALRTLNNYLSGRSSPKAEALGQLAAFCGVNLEWLSTGAGEIRARSVAEIAKEITDEIGPKNVVLIPFHGPGNPLPVAFSKRFLELLELSFDDLAIMQVRGDSMEPTFRDRDFVFFDAGEHGRRAGEGVYVIRLEGAILVKRLQVLPGGQVRIISDNRDYQTHTIAPQEAGDFAVIGRPAARLGRI